MLFRHGKCLCTFFQLLDHSVTTDLYNIIISNNEHHFNSPVQCDLTSVVNWVTRSLSHRWSIQPSLTPLRSLSKPNIFLISAILLGSGGNNHAVDHYDTTKYPLAVKLGTITPGGADVYSYDEDNMVIDPKLAEHLAHFGINMMIMNKVNEPHPLIYNYITRLWTCCE